MASQEPRWRQAAWYYLPSALVMLGLLLAWQFAVDFWQVKEYIVPSPWAALRTLAQPNYQWTVNFLTTLYAVLGAFALSAVLGVVIAVVIVWNDMLMRTIMPVLVLFNTLPKIERDLMQRTIDITFAQNKPDKPVRVDDVFTNAYSSKIMPLR